MSCRLKILLCSAALLATSAMAAGYDAEWVAFPALKDFEGKAVQLDAMMYRPLGAGEFPALVLLHGCSGMFTNQGYITPSYRHWAELLAERGYIALLVDSFGPRGHWSICDQQKRTILERRERVEDAYAALQWLRGEPYVLRDRIGLIGWSNGGAGTLYSMGTANRPDPGFRAAVAFYPGCVTLSQAKGSYRSYAPLLILIGEADDWTPAAACVKLTAAARAAGAPISIVTYPGAYHSFDRINLPVRYRPTVRNLNKPDKLGATVGENPAAREDAIRRTLEFFGKNLRN